MIFNLWFSERTKIKGYIKLGILSCRHRGGEPLQSINWKKVVHPSAFFLLLRGNRPIKSEKIHSLFPCRNIPEHTQRVNYFHCIRKHLGNNKLPQFGGGQSKSNVQYFQKLRHSARNATIKIQWLRLVLHSREDTEHEKWNISECAISRYSSRTSTSCTPPDATPRAPPSFTHCLNMDPVQTRAEQSVLVAPAEGVNAAGDDDHENREGVSAFVPTRWVAVFDLLLLFGLFIHQLLWICAR